MVRELLESAGVAERIVMTGRRRQSSSTCHLFRAYYVWGTVQSTSEDLMR